jgi:hypothetical protein
VAKLIQSQGYYDLLTMQVQANFTGLLGAVSASHIHCCTAAAGSGTAGVATMTLTFIGFPSGVTAGTYDYTFDMHWPTSHYTKNFFNRQKIGNSVEKLFCFLETKK